MDSLTAGMSTDTREWQYHLDDYDAETRANPPTASMSTNTNDSQHVFDNCVRRSMINPENAGVPTSTGEWPHLLSHEGRRTNPTTTSMPLKAEALPFLPSMPIETEAKPCLPSIPEQPRVLNNGPWKDLPSDKADLNKLIHWLGCHNGEWLADALWLRYTKVAKVVYSNRPFLMNHRDRVSKEVIWDTKYWPAEQPPIPYHILPATRPCDKIDRLSGLPHDLRVEILSYLLLPNIRVRLGCPEIVDHTLNSMALVSKSWRDQEDAFCGHALLVWKQSVSKASASEYLANLDSWVEWRALKSYTSCARMEYVFRTRTFCVLCGGSREYLVLSTTLGTMWCRNDQGWQDGDEESYQKWRGY